jgi:regulator of replication initiation timing
MDKKQELREALQLQQQLDAAKQENERLKRQREFIIRVNHEFAQRNRHFRQQLKQAVEALELIKEDTEDPITSRYAGRILASLIQGEANKREPIEITPFNFENRIVECDLPPFEANKEENA